MPPPLHPPPSCVLRYDKLDENELYVFASFFILVAIVSSFLNSFSLKLMYSAMHSSKSSNKHALVSLAVTGCITGFIICPLNTMQMLSEHIRMSCLVDRFRGYLSAIITGNTAFTISLIAYERYLLLKRNKKMDAKKVYVSIAAAWLVPVTIPLTGLIDQQVYYISVSLGILVPYVTLSMSYYYIMQAVKEQETKLLLHYFQQDFMDSTSARKMKVKKRKLKNHLKVAKTVAILIIAYFLCSTPIIMWFVMELINGRYEVAPVETRQIFYACATVLGFMNSCFNPPIYFGKIPEFQKQLNKMMFKRSMRVDGHNQHSQLEALKSNALRTALS